LRCYRETLWNRLGDCGGSLSYHRCLLCFERWRSFGFCNGRRFPFLCRGSGCVGCGRRNHRFGRSNHRRGLTNHLRRNQSGRLLRRFNRSSTGGNRRLRRDARRTRRHGRRWHNHLSRRNRRRGGTWRGDRLGGLLGDCLQYIARLGNMRKVDLGFELVGVRSRHTTR
jgi:hypothetical protein